MIHGQSIICFAGEDWWYHHQHSKNHIMRRLARAGNRVLFINSISMGLPSLSSPALWPKVKRKLKSYARFVRQAEDGVIVVSPIALPFYSSAFARRVNRLLLATQIKLLMIAFELSRPVVWIAIPTAVEMAGRMNESALIYHVSDKYDKNQMDHETSGSLIGEMHRELLRRADLIYYSGRKLFSEETAADPSLLERAKLLEHGVDFDHFASTMSREWEPPDEMAAIPHPRLGYFGSLDAWLIDQELIRHASRAHPEWQWVLVGLKAERLAVEDLPNVHYLGSKPYSEMPRYASQFDVCVLPWVTGVEWVEYGSAIKVREYMATGKPVVITPLYEYERLDGILRISRCHDDFVRKVEEALSHDSPEAKEARQAAVRGGTWDARSEQVSSDIEILLASKADGSRRKVPQPN